MNPQTIQNSWRLSKTLHVDRSTNFAMDDKCEKSRMKEVANELASLISSLNIGNEEMLIEKYVQLAGKEMHSSSWLS